MVNVNRKITEIVFASSNRGKIKEIMNILSPLGIKVIPQQELGIHDAKETGLTFIENAIIKARNACQKSNLPALADDSGLEVEALNGKPGIYSARYSGVHGSAKKNNEKLLNAMHNCKDRRANFRCVLVFMRNAEDPAPKIAQGIWEGKNYG